MWKNYSHSIENTNQVITPKNIDELQNTLRNIKRTQTLRCISAAHSYSGSITSGSEIEGDTVVLCDLKHFNGIYLDTKKSIVEVGPAVTFEQLMIYLEENNCCLPNSTGCLSLSLGGCFSMASHGSGYLASVPDLVQSVRIMNAKGEICNVKNTSKEFKLIAGGMGVFGIVLELTLNIVPQLEYYSEEHIPVEIESKQFLELIQDTTAQMEDTNLAQKCFDHFYWTPIRNYAYYFRRRKVDSDHNADKINYESTLGKLSDSLSPISAKVLDQIRNHNWISADTAFTLLANLYGVAVKQYSTCNTFYSLSKPISDVATKIRDSFEVAHDCELFFPRDKIMDVLHMYNFLYTLILTDSENEMKEEEEFIHQLKNNDLWDELQIIRSDRKHARISLFTAPLEVRYVPKTYRSYMAPNAEQDVWSISFGWFGRKEHLIYNKRVLQLFIKVGIRLFDCKLHWGKYSPLGEIDKNDSLIVEIKKRYSSALHKYNQANKLEPLFQNKFTQDLFAFDQTLK